MASRATPIKSAPSARKKAARPTRTRHEQRKAAQPPSDPTRLAHTIMGQLPPNFTPDGFEIIGDQVRVYGKVKPIDQDKGRPEPANEAVGRAYGELVHAEVKRASSPLMDAIGSYGLRLDELSHALEHLNDMGASILTPEPPEPAGAAGHANGSPQTGPAGAYAVNLLHEHTLRLERLIGRVNNITSRVQA